MSFKLHYILSRVMKSHAVLLCCTLGMNYPSVQHIPSASHSVAISMIRSTVKVSQCWCSMFILLDNDPKVKGSDTRDLDVPERSCKLLPLGEKVNILNLIREGKNQMSSLLRSTARTNLL